MNQSTYNSLKSFIWGIAIDCCVDVYDVGIPVPEMDKLSNIIATFHDIWGNCDLTDEDRVKKQVADLPEIVAQDEAYQNAMKYSDAQNAHDESDRATKEAMFKSTTSVMELYTAFQDDMRNKTINRSRNGCSILCLL